MRHWYGTYDMGFGTFILGQTWTPTFNPICNECLLGGGGFLDGFGDFGGSARKAWPAAAHADQGRQRSSETCPSRASAGGQQDAAGAAAVDGRLPTALHRQQRPLTLDKVHLNPNLQSRCCSCWLDTQSDTTLPTIEASLSAAFGPTSLTFVGGYNTFDVKNDTTDQTREH